MSEPLLKIRNHHSLSCGDPPIVDGGDANTYIGYFENPHGEQWIFTYDRKAGKGLLRGGDVGWNTAIEVVDEIPGVVLGAAEALWLKACWKAATVNLFCDSKSRNSFRNCPSVTIANLLYAKELRILPILQKPGILIVADLAPPPRFCPPRAPLSQTTGISNCR